MAAFSQVRTETIGEAIRNLYRRSWEYLPCTLKSSDIIEIFVQPEHRETVVNATDLFRGRIGGSFTCALEGTTLVIVVSGKGKEAFVFPHYIGDGLYCEDTHPALVKLKGWLAMRRQMAIDFGTIWMIFHELNSICESPSQVRFFWPEVVALMAIMEHTSEAADTVRTFRTPTHLPKVPKELRDACKASKLPIMKALLLPNPENDPPPPPGPVSLAVGDMSLPALPWDEGRAIPVL
jgi:hypothetical protein